MDYSFICRFSTSKEELENLLRKLNRDDLVSWWDDGEQGYKTTTKENFESEEFWRGRPMPGPDAMEVLGE